MVFIATIRVLTLGFFQFAQCKLLYRRDVIIIVKDCSQQNHSSGRTFQSQVNCFDRYRIPSIHQWIHVGNILLRKRMSGSFIRMCATRRCEL